MFEFLRFELRQQLSSPVLWLMGLLFAALAFGAASTDAIILGGSVGNVHRNAPKPSSKLPPLSTCTSLNNRLIASKATSKTHA